MVSPPLVKLTTTRIKLLIRLLAVDMVEKNKNVCEIRQACGFSTASQDVNMVEKKKKEKAKSAVSTSL